MRRVKNRAWIMVLFMLALLCGMCLFLFEYAVKAPVWVIQRGSPHVFSTSNVGKSLVIDRDGNLLLDTTESRVYSDNASVRQATLHWLGDRNGNIRGTVLSSHVGHMTGYDLVNGVYGYGESDSQVTLTLSSRVQVAALNALAGRKGTVAVYNYKTGQILCAVTTPTYDPDNVPDIAGDSSGIYEGVYLNRFIQSTYPPGSIFKIVTTAAALDSVEGIREMTFSCSGTYEFGGSRVTCGSAHGSQNLKQALANSCNCAFAQISHLIGAETLSEYVDAFGVMKSVEFDGLTTAEGNFDLANADKVGLAWSAIGQYTDMINPCSYLTFLGAVAGGGEGAVPYLVDSITLDGEVTYEAYPQMGQRIMPKELASELQEYLRNNVQTVYGAGNFPGLTVCAKSGTSELGGGKTPNAMFAGFVTDEDYPLAFIAVVENGGYGANTCVPILSKVLAECKAVLDANP